MWLKRLIGKGLRRFHRFWYNSENDFTIPIFNLVLLKNIRLMLFEDYKKEVLKSYQQKKNAGELSDNLSMPTPKKLRDECLMVLVRRYDRKDEEAIRLFFDPLNQYDDLAKRIERIEVDKFRPLINFVKGEINRTEDKNVKLLAWLIDFEPRPFKFVAFEQKLDNEQKNKSEAIKHNQSNVQSPPQPLRLNLLKILALLFVLIITAGIYLIKYRSANAAFTNDEKCMYWAGDHYQPISCSAKKDGAIVVALDTARLLQFKKITTPDTITIKSVGKVYYFKHNNSLDFFTSGGFHPVYLDRKLKPLTAYMLTKYTN